MSSLILKKIFFISVALLASAAPFGKAQAAEPDIFPQGQEVPLPGPVQTGEVTLWQLPEDYRSVIKTEEGEVYGIYYSAWARKDTDTLPGVFGAKWITNEDNNYQPWKENPELAKELSEKYFGEKKGLMISCTEDNLLGKNCVAGENGEVKNLKLHGFWNGGGFAYAKAKGNDGLVYVLRPHGTKGFGTDPIAYYWNGDLYRTASGAEYKIQFFAGCKLTTIDRTVSSESLVDEYDCSGEGVAPVFDGGTLEVAGAGESDSNFVLFDAKGNAIDNEGFDFEFSGVFSGDGGVIFKGGGVTTLSGNNVYAGATTIQEGTLKLGSATGVPQSSATTIKAGGTLDLNSKSPRITSITLDGGAGSGAVAEILESTAKIHGGPLTGTITSKGGLISGVTGADLNVKSGRTFLRDESSLGTVNVTGGQLWAADDDPVSVANLILNTNSFTPDDRRNADRTLTADVQDGLVLGFDDDAGAALEVTGTFTYTDGNVYLYKPAGDAGKDYEGTWKVMDFNEGDLSDEQYEELFANTYLMYETPDGDLEYFQFAADGSSADADLLREVTLKKGSLKVEVGELDLSKPNPGGNGGETIEDEIEDEIIDEIDAAGDGGGTIDFDDGSLEEIGDEFEIFIKEELVGVVTHGLLPLNVDGPGQTLATYNNVLADTIFERTPMRQLIEVEPAVAAEPIPEPEVNPAAEPVQGLWSKEAELDDQEANAFLAEQTASMPLVVADAHTHAEHQSEHLIEINGKSYAENESLTAEYAGRDGVRGWFRGFGSNSADSNGESNTVFNPYSISSGGGVVGVDVSVSESVQIGAYANYGNINLWQRNGVEGLSGSWEADGWGGGVTADYWTNNFYVQGLIGGTGFSGQKKRSIKGYGAFFDDQTASGEKSATSVVGALRLGAPFQSGSTYFEPQFTATWTGNNENRFSESTSDDQLALTYKSRTTNYLQTALGMKVAWPMKTGTTGLLTPSVKVAWLGDWDMGNEDQKIGFDFTNKGYAVSSNQENVNGALIEAGLDYSVVKLEGTTVKAYLRGGAEVWGGERGTQWRASGGVTFQF